MSFCFPQRYEEEPKSEYSGNLEQKAWEDEQINMASFRAGEWIFVPELDL